MDTFFEQIVPVSKTGKTLWSVIGIWLLAGIVCLALILFGGYFPFFAVMLFAGVIYGAYKWSSRFNLEYEYIITNGTIDIDKIMSKSMRKRITTFDLSDVSRLEKFNPSAQVNGKFTTKVIACNETDPNAYLLVASKEGKGDVMVVMSPDQRMKTAMCKFMPKFISNSAFK